MKLNKKIVLGIAGALFITGAVATITTGRFLGFGGKINTEKKTPAIAEFDDRTDNEKEAGYGTPTGDDPFEELKKISRMFTQGGVEYTGNIQLLDADDEALIEQVGFSGNLNGADYQYMLDSVEFLKTKDVSAILYHNQKQLVVMKEWQGAGPQLFNIDSLKKYMEAAGSEAMVYRQGNEKIIRVKNTGDMTLYGYALYYNAADYKIRKVDYDVMSLEDLSTTGLDGLGEETVDEEVEEEAEELPDSLASGITVDTVSNSIRMVTESYLYKMTFNFTRMVSRPVISGFKPGDRYFNVDERQVTLKTPVKDYELVNLYHEPKQQ
jgi:hypothetical protein